MSATPADETKQPTVNTSKDVPTDQGLLRDPFPQQREPRTSALDGETRSQDTSGGADAPLPRTEGLTPPPPRHRRGSRPPKQFQPPKAAATQKALYKKQVRERRAIYSLPTIHDLPPTTYYLPPITTRYHHYTVTELPSSAP